jgi:putative ABC transport system permease protein
VVIGHNVRRGAKLGERISVFVDGKQSQFTIVGVAEEVGGNSAFVTEAAFTRATGITGASLLRFATTAATPAERARIIAELEKRLADRDLAVMYAMPALLLRSIIDDHVIMVVRVVMVMAILLALVGFVGLGSAMSINIAERMREIGIMKAIGASSGRILRIILGEAAAIAITAFAIAAVLAIPLTVFVDGRIGAGGFLADPPVVVSTSALIACGIAMLAGSALACAIPARRAARMSVRVALVET